MKSVPVRQAQQCLPELIAEACRGEIIVLTDGEKQVTLEPQMPMDLEQDSPELEAELLKGVDGPFAPYSPDEMREIGERILRQKQSK